MTPINEEMDLRERLSLIEKMIAEGRQATGSWGWAFVLWGAAYYVAVAWSARGNPMLAWPVTMIAAGIITGLLARRQSSRRSTTMGRALGAIWISTGISMFLLFMALGASGRLTDFATFAAVAGAMLGMANAISAIILRWRMQMACAVVWWAAAVASAFAGSRSLVIFIAAIFFCQILFGIYAMMRDAGMRKARGVAHA